MHTFDGKDLSFGTFPLDKSSSSSYHYGRQYRRSMCARCGRGLCARAVLGCLSFLQAAAAAALAVLVFTDRVVVSSWLYAAAAFPLAAAVLGGVVVACPPRSSRPWKISVAALHTFVCALATACNLAGIALYSVSQHKTEKTSPWVYGDTFMRCEAVREACFCVHEGDTQRVEDSLCQNYSVHMSLLLCLKVVRALHIMQTTCSLLAAASTAVLLSARRRQHNVNRRKTPKRMLPTPYESEYMMAQTETTTDRTSTQSLPSAIYERLGSVNSSAYLSPLPFSMRGQADETTSNVGTSHTV